MTVSYSCVYVYTWTHKQRTHSDACLGHSGGRQLEHMRLCVHQASLAAQDSMQFGTHCLYKQEKLCMCS